MATPRQHIDHIRKSKFAIGGEANPLIEDLHQAVKHLSAELYTKDVHFLMELIQNAEDNEYPEGVDPSLEFVITSRDITATGAPATLLIFNNEKGFSPKNIESICSVGRSTKRGNRKRGYIGEKGIGFKSVFLITAQPYVFSNGYQIRFNEGPCPRCNLGYIVPEWVEESPTISDIKQIYGSGPALPTTTIILPLKPDKVKPVKQQLSSVHPEVLLFLSKIKCLSVKEDNEDPKLNTVSAISITSETNFLMRKNIDAESYTLHLSADENNVNLKRECGYYMWKQKFPVRPENKVDRRMEIEEWVINLAFPIGERLHRGSNLPGVYAFLPTEMVTGFPFIIQADFVLQSSRETILLDDKWNQGILDCLPSAFINAFISLVKTAEDAPVSSLPRMFDFLPVNSSSYEKLNAVRESIRVKLVEENIVPSESYKQQKFFHKPSEVGRLVHTFWNILKKARENGVSLHNLSSHGRYILHSSFDKPAYDHILNFLGVMPVNCEWYVKCIKSSNLILGVPEYVYMKLLLFLIDNWQSKFHSTSITSVPLIKYVSMDGSISLSSIDDAFGRNNRRVLCMSTHLHHADWLINCNKEFRCVANYFFLPSTTQVAIQSCSRKESILEWLQDRVNVVALDVSDYADLVRKYIIGDRKLVVAYAHFLYHSSTKNFLSVGKFDSLYGNVPLVDNYGNVTTRRNGVLVPANDSRWTCLLVSNPWRQEGYVELGEDYLLPGNFAGESISGEQLIQFLEKNLGVSDIPSLHPANAGISAVYGPLTKENVFLLLDWIRCLRHRGARIPEKFLTSIKEGSWLRITMNGSSGYRPPSESFFYTSKWGNILQNGSVLVDIPLVDQSFYGDKLAEFKEELKIMGVMFGYGDACNFIGKRLMSLAKSSTLTKSNVLSILNFIRYLRAQLLSPNEFIQSIREGRWLRTRCGERSPAESVLFDQEWKAASLISNIPFIDQEYYGEEIMCFKTELQLLGVIVGFSESYQLVACNLKSASSLTPLTSDALLLILKCIRHLRSSEKLVNTLKSGKFLKTNSGYRTSSECFLFDPEWGCLLNIFGGFAVLDHDFYGSSIFSYRTELKKIGVVVEFDDAAKAFAVNFKKLASLSFITKDTVMAFLSCYRQLKGTSLKFPIDLKSCLHDVKWLRTRLGDFRYPRECILFGPEWESISPIALLPFIDDSDNYYGKGIHEYRKELKSMGVILELKGGAKYVVDDNGLCFPPDPCYVTSENALALLKFIGISLERANYSLTGTFLKKVSQRWLKTYAGYMSPNQCLLFDSNWSLFLKPTDGPFIDEEFYGPQIQSYRKELNAIGVIVDAEKACALLASYLGFHSEINTIVRMYKFLKAFKWKPETDDVSRIWIPDGNKSGEWVDSMKCVLHDKNGLFGSQLCVLEKYYESDLLTFFSSVLNVRAAPSLDDYCKLWKLWESTGHRLSHTECSAFWEFVVRHRSPTIIRSLSDNIEKLPIGSGSGEILLSKKQDVFIGDDLLLKDLFEQLSTHQIFVWYSQPSLPSLPRTKLLDAYRSIGVRKISESVQMEELSLSAGSDFKQINSKDTVFGKGLVRLMLGFLADPCFEMEFKERHEAVQCLLNVEVFESPEPITVCYSLSLSCGQILKVKASRMVRWDRESSKFFTQKMDKSGGHKFLLEYATYFSEVISEGVLWEKEDQIGSLAELIKLGFLLEFNEEAVGFLMKSKNLQLFVEDEEFLSAAFPSE